MNYKKSVISKTVLAAVLCIISAVLFPALVNAADDLLSDKAPFLIRPGELLSLKYDIKDASKLSMQHAKLVLDSLAVTNASGPQIVYAQSDEDSGQVGRICETTKVEVISRNTEWAHITTGKVEGYVPADSLLYGDKAQVLMNAKCDKIAEITSDCDAFASNNEASLKISSPVKGDTFSFVRRAGDWCKLNDGERDLYVKYENLKLSDVTDNGLSMGEVLVCAPDEKELDRMYASGEITRDEYQAMHSNYMNYLTITMTDEERALLSKVVRLEAGDNYNEAVKVVNVVFNRVLDSRYDNTVMGVLTAPIQFSTIYDAWSEDAFTTQNCLDAIDDVSKGLNTAGMAVNFVSSGDGIHNIYSGYADFDVRFGF